jgi:TatD DNase family protein
VTLPSIDAHAHVNVGINPRELSALNALVFAVTRSLEEGAAALGRSDAMTLWGLGCHPAAPEAVAAFDADRFAALLPRAAFVGEVGLDRKSRVPIERQRQVLGQILDLVGRTPRAVSLHATGASTPVLDLLEQHPVRFPILHWWRGSASETRRAVGLGAFFSLNGHEAKSPKVVELIPLERMLTETDFPFSKRYDPGADRPSAVRTIEDALALLHRVTVDELRRQMWANLAPLIDTVPDGVASDVLRALVDSTRRSASDAPRSLRTGR